MAIHSSFLTQTVVLHISSLISWVKKHCKSKFQHRKYLPGVQTSYIMVFVQKRWWKPICQIFIPTIFAVLETFDWLTLLSSQSEASKIQKSLHILVCIPFCWIKYKPHLNISLSLNLWEKLQENTIGLVAGMKYTYLLKL